MARLNLKEYYPINDSAELKKTSYSDLSESEQKQWRNFKIITRSNFMKKKLLENQSNNCPICSKTLIDKKTVVHHLDYKQLCNFNDFHRHNIPTEKKPHRVLNVPKCDICYSYQNCLNKVILIHLRCHFILHKKEGRIEKTEKEKVSFLNREKKYKLNELAWNENSSKPALNLIYLLLNFINENSVNGDFYIRYNQKYISLKPDKFIYFKPDGNNLLISVGLGNLNKWHQQLIQRKIEVKIRLKFKKTYRIYFSFDVSFYEENKEIILNILKDAIDTYEKD
ncbi:MAG: Uncharacterised protein [Polaribacter sp. SA4-10]|nr:MAG: Uncharacterised protein [Polaribacter sp. SA4-10]